MLILPAGLLLQPAAHAGPDKVPPAGVIEKKPTAKHCIVDLDFAQQAAEQVKIDLQTLKVSGPDFSLKRDGDVFYGFMLSKPTRFRIKPKSISGTAAGMDLMLHIKRGDFSTEVTGLVGIRRVTVRVGTDKVSVDAAGSSMVSSTAHLALSRTSGNRLKGQIGLGSGMAPATLETHGCDLEFIRKRPALIVILFMWWLGV